MEYSRNPLQSIARVFFVALALFGLVSYLSSCSIARKLNKHTDSRSVQSETETAAKMETKAKTASAVDSTGETTAETKTAEAATNEAVEETTTTRYDAATGRIASVTHSRRRATGTATKTAQGSTTAKAAVSRQAETETAAKTETKQAAKSSETHKTLDKQADTKVKTPLGTYALIVGGVLVAGSLAWKFVPALSAYGAGGPVGLLFAWFRRRKEQSAV